MRQAIIASFLTHEMNLVLILCTFCYSQAQATLKTLIYKSPIIQIAYKLIIHLTKHSVR